MVQTKSLTLWVLDTLLPPRESEKIYFYQGHIFFHSLELVPIHNNRALEVAFPTGEDLEPFVQSQFDGPHINCLLLAHYWNHGDKLMYSNKSGPWYYLCEVLWRDQTVRARKICTHFGDSNLGSSTSGLDNVQLHLLWTKHIFTVCNSVKITFSPHKGISGTLIAVRDETVIIMTTNFIEVSKNNHSYNILLTS